MRKKHELLKHAYDKYPKGTKYISFTDGELISIGKFKISEDNTILMDGKYSGVVYCVGKWATIVTEPEKIAVKVSNEFEFNELMKYYDSLNITSKSGIKASELQFRRYDDLIPSLLVANIGFIIFPNKGGYNEDGNEIYNPDAYTVIDYADFAKENGLTTIAQKKYAQIHESLLESIIKIGQQVVVTDGSYMIDAQTGEHINGIYFKSNNLYEVLTVTKINEPFKTDYSVLTEVLSVHNNCEITGFDGRKYYCSKINIKQLK